MKRRISILGSTGSVGSNALDVVDRFQDRFEVLALAGGRNVERLAEQARRFRPNVVGVRGEEEGERLLRELGPNGPGVLVGIEGYREIASLPDVDLVISSMVGSVGLVPTYEAILAGKTIALANKEILVMAGELVMEASSSHGSQILPVDSEHSALFQSMTGHRKDDIRRLILTASGGPFFNYTKEQLAGVSADQARRHPNWDMGEKISVDSASLMNKGFEVIEARWLFDIPEDRIEVLIHKESIVHSLVEYVDGSCIAQLGLPDMRIPILYALSFPERLPLELPSLDLARVGTLSFVQVDQGRFPAFALALQALRDGGSLPAVLSAADEVCVQAFLDGEIGFTDIPEVVQQVLASHQKVEFRSVEEVLGIDAWAREKTEAVIQKLKEKETR